MANPPRVQIQGLPHLSDNAFSNQSPARGKEMRATLLQKLRPPPLVHAWDFWHDRQDRTKSSSFNDKSDEPAKYEDRLVKLTEIVDVKDFWEMFNNFDVTKMPLRDSVHLFHKGVKPVWEDPRNVKGGSWTFRVPKDRAQEFWKEMCMMAIGEALQQAVEDPKRITFRDDICGISLSIRFTSTLITIWNRDGNNTKGIQNILDVVLEQLPSELQPKESAYYYKKHSEHAGFAASVEQPQTSPPASRDAVAEVNDAASNLTIAITEPEENKTKE